MVWCAHSGLCYPGEFGFSGEGPFHARWGSDGSEMLVERSFTAERTPEKETSFSSVRRAHWRKGGAGRAGKYHKMRQKIGMRCDLPSERAVFHAPPGGEL